MAESAFIGAQRALDVIPGDPVCLKIHDMIVSRGAFNGDIVGLRPRAVYVGRTSITIDTEAFDQ